MVEVRDGNEPEKDNERHGSESHDLKKKWAGSSVGHLAGAFHKLLKVSDTETLR